MFQVPNLTGIRPDFEAQQKQRPLAYFKDAHVLLVGVDQYDCVFDGTCPELKNLSGVAEDIYRFADFLDKLKVEVTLLPGLQADRAGVTTVFSTLKSKARYNQRSLLFVLWAGHALLSETDGKPYLMLRDTDPLNLAETGLAFDAFLDDFDDDNILVDRRVLTLDVCHSGSLVSEALGGKLSSRSDISLLSSSTRLQKSGEDDGGGFFTQGLLRGLSGYGKVLGKDPLTVTLQEAFRYARAEVAARGSQTPLIAGSENSLPMTRFDQKQCDYILENIVSVSSPPRNRHRVYRDLVITVTMKDHSLFDSWKVRVNLDYRVSGKRNTHWDTRLLESACEEAKFKFGKGWLRGGRVLNYAARLVLIPKKAGMGEVPLPSDCWVKVNLSR
ncbi:MAG: caspase family protein [Acidobacteriota bacterium]|nr:caspase family protein [Acidobacteriota bacterium]